MIIRSWHIYGELLQSVAHFLVNNDQAACILWNFHSYHSSENLILVKILLAG